MSRRKKILPTRNKFEQEIFNGLSNQKIKFSYESLKIPYILSRVYIPDFEITSRSGVTFLLEAKGYLRPEHKAKMVAVKQQHPELDIRILFYRKKASDTRWADKYGFKYAVKEIPEEWLT